MLPYNNYHKHDHVSNIFTPDCNVHAEDYIKKTVEYGLKNYFTTNHGSFGDIFEAKTLCDQYGIGCKAGIEGYIVPDPLEKDKSNYHFIAIPLTDKARKELNYASSMANIKGYYYKPRFFISDLINIDPKSVIITTACVAGLLRDDNSIQNIFMPLLEHYKENMYLEVQSHIDDTQIEINKKALKYADEFGLKIIAANDSHYIDAAGQTERLELLKGKHIEYGSEDSFILDFPTAETMKERFLCQGILSEQQIDEAISNTLVFDECEDIQLDHSIKMPTIYPELTPTERVALLKEKTIDRFRKIVKEEHITGDELKKYKAGIRYEMDIIEATNEEIHTADYFLFNERNVDLAVNKYGGVLTRGGRGSCGSFYINRIFGMTQLDRFKINLPIFPDRFASTARLLENRALPDIDFNVKEQEPFVKASRELLGEHGCYPMYAPGTMQLSEAFRNVCRSKELDYDSFNDVAKDIENHMDDPQWADIIDEAQKYVGTIVSGSVHPCAHLLSDKNLLYEYGVTRLGENLCVLITSSEADAYKVLKNDYLIVKVWKLIDETFKEIGIPIIPANQLLDAIKDDERIWNLFRDGLTCTLNQVDSDNGMNQARRYGIKSFEEGAYIAAAIRPSFDAWREKFLNHESYTTGSEDLDNVLSMTHGYILYQENLMQYFEWLGITPSESIGLIKKISKKKIKPEDFSKLETRIRAKWIENTGSEDMFDDTWNMIQGCMSYGFCSAHAAATSLDMCYGAYLKVNYPYEYYTVCFNNYSDDMPRTNKLIKELQHFDITLSGIRFGYSKSDYSYNKEEKKIYKGLKSIKFISENLGEELYNIGRPATFYEVLKAIKNTSCNSRQLEILIKLDFFRDYGDINLLLKQAEIYDTLAGKKILKKDNLPDYIPKYIVEKYSTATEKQYKITDNEGLIVELFNNINVKEANIIDKIGYQVALLGYIDTVLPDMKPQYYYVTNVDGNWIMLFQLKTGKLFRVKTRKKILENNPINPREVIKVLEVSEEPKWIKVGDKWDRDYEHKEKILTKYLTINS